MPLAHMHSLVPYALLRSLYCPHYIRVSQGRGDGHNRGQTEHNLNKDPKYEITISFSKCINYSCNC